jgi:hypothetical protein
MSLVVVAFLVILGLDNGSPGFLVCLAHPLYELIYPLDSGWLDTQLKAHAGMAPSVEEEGCLLSRGVDCIVVRKLGRREKLIPVVVALINKEPKINLQLLVDTLCLTIGLWMVSS